MANALRTNQEDGEKFLILNCIKSSFCLKDVMVAEYMSLKKNLKNAHSKCFFTLIR